MKVTTPKGRKRTIVSILVSSAFLFNSICFLANILVPSMFGFGDIFIILVLLVGILMCFPLIRLNWKNLFLNFVLLLWMALSYIYYDGESAIAVIMQNFIVWGFGVTIIMMQDYDLKLTLEISLYMSCIVIIFELVSNAQLAYEPMTWSYAIFPCIATMLVHFAYCRFDGVLKRLLYIPGFIMLVKFVMFANRGAIVSLMALLYLIAIKGIHAKKELKNKKFLNKVLLVLLICVVLFYEEIIYFLYDFTTSLGYDISSVGKMYRLILEDNVTNNRSELYAYAMNGFLNSPLWGNGIGGFSANHGGWVHNIVLQLLYEGGILLFTIILVPVAKITIYFLKGKNIDRDMYAFFTLLFCTSVPRLLFSTELWNTQGFWMLIAFGMACMNGMIRRKDR